MADVYHVITRGNNKAAIFHDDQDFTSYIEIITESKSRYAFSLFHFCLMDNHVHLVISPESHADLPLIMHAIDLNYSRYHKRKYGRVGRLWQDNYRKYLITTHEYLLTCGIYVELNPVRARVVRSPAEYRWSSHRFYVSASEWDFLTESPNYLCMGRNREERKAYYAELVKMWQEFPPSKREAKRFFRGGASGFHPGMEG